MNPEIRGTFTKLFSSKQTFPDFSKGFISAYDDANYDKSKKEFTCESKKIISKIEGEWTVFLKIDENVYWNHDDPSKYKLEKQEFTLDSDTRLRSDLLFFKEKNTDQAQLSKAILEEIQRKDRKLRQNYKKINQI